jgi:dTDP-4-amino-4,6-dideoxygalactose transaminase
MCIRHVRYNPARRLRMLPLARERHRTGGVLVTRRPSSVSTRGGRVAVSSTVPFVDLRAQARELHDEFHEVFASVTSRAAYTMGPELKEFEVAFAAFCEAKHCVGVDSGTAAVRLALQVAGVEEGDEVIVPANTFIATAEAVSHLGATPVFVDCVEDTALIDVAQLETAGSEMTKAVVPVHLYGQPCDMDAIAAVAGRRGLAVVEDACQAHGARYKGRRAGSFGVAAAFSFYPGKNLGALGDGGAVTTQHDELRERLLLLRNHGQADKYTHSVVGWCSRLHNLQAGILGVKLARLEAWNAARRRAAARYDELLAGVDGVEPIRVGNDVEPVCHLYVVRVQERDAVREKLGADGVESGIHYPVPLHLQPAYASLGYGRGDFPVSERLCERILSLPMFPEISDAQIDYVVERLALAVGRG